MHYFLKSLLGLVFLLCFYKADAKVLLVNSINNSGPGTLRDQVAASSAGDTIMMDIKGTINLTSTININKKLRILGAFPVHNEINGSLLGSASAIEVNGGSTDTVFIEGFRFSNCNGSTGAIFIMANASAVINSCLFKNNSGSAFGQAITVATNSKAFIINSSFISNSTTNQGGAISINAGSSIAAIRNCTFSLNSAPSNGGAINNTGALSVGNCTFLDNSSASGADIRNMSGTVELYNNILSNASPSNQLASSVGLWNNQGGNVYSGNSINYTAIVGVIGTDIFTGSQANIQLSNTPTVDGYGLEYFRIAQQTSPCVDNGVLSGQVLPTDCRRAPRSLYGDNALLPDAGAVEYTPHIFNSPGAAPFMTSWGNMDSYSFPGPKYIEFNLPGPTTFNLTSPLTNPLTVLNTDLLIDGFTQPGSVIPGPGATPGSYTPAVYGVTIVNTSSDIFTLDDLGSKSFIAGLKLDNQAAGSDAIEILEGISHIYGNKIVSTGSGAVGLHLGGIFYALVGGPRHHFRNVIGGQAQKGILAQNYQTDVQGNFIGTDDIGMNPVPNDIGVEFNTAVAVMNGRMGFPSKNIVSGNVGSHVVVNNGYFYIYGNIIGADATTMGVVSTGAGGINANANTDGFIGGMNPSLKNVIGGCAGGINLFQVNSAVILGNFIGISPNGASNFPLIPNQGGIFILDNGGSNHQIGNGTFAGRNFICGNTNLGIHVDNAASHQINGNFIGVKPNNTAAGNGQHGILLENSSSGNNILNNLISNHTVAGIEFNTTGGMGSIANNLIGLDSTGMVAQGNVDGIRVFNDSGTPLSITNNFISGNTGFGIFIDNTAENVNNNIIGLGKDTLTAIGNGAGMYIQNAIGNQIFFNIISGNGGDGIHLAASSDNIIRGNHIGTNPSGTNLGNNGHGIAVFFISSGNSIGGAGAADHNKIWFNNGAGINVGKESFQVGIQGNSFFQNAAHGITFNAAVNPSIPLANDANDPDVSGAGALDFGNNGQNFPVLNACSQCSVGPTLNGTLNVDDVTKNYVIQIYRVSPATIDASGHGEGDSLIATQSFPTGGLNTFNFSMPFTGLGLGDIIAVTATKDIGGIYETSEFSDTIEIRGPATASITGAANISCFGANDGQATATHTGTAPFTYDWINAASGTTTGLNTQTVTTLPTGMYYCIVTDANCSVLTDTVLITEPAALSVSVSPTNPTCFGSCDGTLVLTESGGVGSYQYSIDNGATFQAANNFNSLCAGGYQYVVMDANGCMTPAAGNTVNLFSPGAISVAPSVSNETCDGLDDGSITLTAAGGNGGFTYQLAGGGFSAVSSFSGLAPGSYTYDVMDSNGCISSGVATVNSGNIVTADFSVSTTNGCQNTFDFDFTDASNFGSSTMDSLVWTFPSGSPSSAINVSNVNNVMLFNAGANSVTLHAVATDGCYHDTTITVTVNPAVFADAGLDTTICIGTPFTHVGNVFGGTAGFNYSWTPVGNFVTSIVEDPSITTAVSNTTGSYIHVMNVTDANGCFDLDSVIVTVVGLPTVSAGADFNVCQGNTATLSGGGSAISYSWDNSVTNATAFIPASTLTYTVTGTDANGCSNTDQVVVTVETPYVINAGTDFNVCENISTITLSGTTNSPTHLWTQNNGAGGMANSTALAATYSLASVDTIQTTLDFIFSAPANGVCPAIDDTLFVTLDNVPIVDAGNTPPNSCNTVPVPLAGMGANSPSYTWSTTGTGSFSPINNPNSNYNPGIGETGIVMVYLTAAANGACPSQLDSAQINLVAGPTINAGPDMNVCRTGTPSITLTGSGTDFNTINWTTLGSGSWVNGTTLTPDYFFSGADASGASVSLVIDVTPLAGSCPNASDTMVVTFFDPSSAFAGADVSVCASNPVVNLNGGATGQASVDWTNGAGTYNPDNLSLNTNYTLSAAEISAGSVTLTLTAYAVGGVCPNSTDDILITVMPNPILSANGDTAICAGSNITLNASGTGTFVWTSLLGFTGSGATVTDIPLATDTYTVTLTDGNNCTNTEDVIVTVNQAPTGTISGAGTYCEGTLVDITFNISTSNFDINILLNGNPLGLNTSPSNPYIYGTTSFGGTYTAIVTDDVTGCSDTLATSINVIFNPEPDIAVGSPINMCDNTLSFDLNTTLSPTPAGGAWTGAGVSGSTFDPASAGVGTHDLIYTLTGCDDTMVVIISAPPVVAITGVANAYCETDPPFTPTGTPAGGDWSLDGGTFGPLTSVDPSTLSIGTHSLSYQFTDAVSGCVATSFPQTFTVSAMPLDPIITSPLNQTICSGGTVTLTATNPNSGNGSIIWYADLGLTNQLGLGPTYVSPPLTGSTNIYMAIVNAGCNTSINVFVITVNNAQVMAGPDVTICPGTPAQLNVTNATGTISWSPGNSLSDSTIVNPIATPNVNTTYVVTVVSGPCVDSDSVNVIIDGSNPNCGFIPSYNAFSPDGDGVNDSWIIDAALLHPDNTVTVFNRWGDKLVSFEDYNNVTVVWDGMYKGNLLPSGTYFYVIEYHDINQQVSSWVQLTR